MRAADTVPKASRGWDNAKKVNGRKRHIAVDTTGLVLAVVITAANTQDPRRRPAAAMESAPRLPPYQARLGRCRIHVLQTRQTGG